MKSPSLPGGHGRIVCDCGAVIYRCCCPCEAELVMEKSCPHCAARVLSPLPVAAQARMPGEVKRR